MAQDASPIEITAVVPEGSWVIARTQSADVIADGTYAAVAASTQTGDIRLGRTRVAVASSVSGKISISDFGGTAQLNSMAGNINVHATVGGDITAMTMSGNVTVTATDQAQSDDLDVHANSMSGSVHVPLLRPCGIGSGPRRCTS